MSIPNSLKLIPHWVCYALSPDKSNPKPRKVPKNPLTGTNAKPNDPNTWSTYDAAVSACARYSYAGLGFMLTKDTHLVAIDIDHCYDPATAIFNDTAAAILARQPTYAEISPSGDGIHLWYYGEKPGPNSKNTNSGVEMYDTLRYLTVTGNTLPDALPDIAVAGPDTLRWIYDTYINVRKPPSQSGGRAHPEIAALDDDDLLHKAQTGPKGEDFRNLWEGRWQGRYPSQSEADLALCMKLAYWSGRRTDQMDRLFRRSALMRDKWDVRHHADGATYGAETLRMAAERTDRIYCPSRTEEIVERDGRYYRIRGDSCSQLTNFTVVPLRMIVSPDQMQLTAELVTDIGETFTMDFMSAELSASNRFRNFLTARTMALAWFGTEGDLELFKLFLYNLEWKKCVGVRAAGIYEHQGRNVFVCGDGCVEAGGLAVEDMVQLADSVCIKTGILQHPMLTPSQLMSIGTHLLSYNEKPRTVTVLGWVAGCFLKEYLRQSGIRYPHLFLIGSAGSGKSSTLKNIIMPIVSNPRRDSAGGYTAFTVMKDGSSSNTVPMLMDEYKPAALSDNQKNILNNHFRDSYDGHVGMRGRADQSMEMYKLLAPVAVAGEQNSAEVAVRERSLVLIFSRQQLTVKAQRDAFEWICRNSPLLGSFGRSLLDQALYLDQAAAVGWYDTVRPFFNQELPARIIDNMACCYCGLKLTEKLCNSLGSSWEEIFGISLTECKEHMEYAVLNHLLEGSTNSKSVVEETLEVISRMNLDPKNDYLFNEDKTVLYLRINRIYDQYTKYRRDYAVTGEVLPYDQFKKQLLFTDLVIENNMQKKFGAQNVRCWALDYKKLSARCDVSGFIRAGISPLTDA